MYKTVCSIYLLVIVCVKVTVPCIAGRGFGVWCEFVNLTAVVMTLLELQTDPLVPIEVKKAIAQSGNIPGTGNTQIFEIFVYILRFL